MRKYSLMMFGIFVVQPPLCSQGIEAHKKSKAVTANYITWFSESVIRNVQALFHGIEIGFAYC